MLSLPTFVTISVLARTLTAIPHHHREQSIFPWSNTIAPYASYYEGTQPSAYTPSYEGTQPSAYASSSEGNQPSAYVTPSEGTQPSATTALNPPASTPTSTLAPSSNNNGSNPDSTGIGLSPNCFKPNNIPVGWLPNGDSITSIQSQVSTQGPCTYGSFAQITTTTSMPDEQIQGGAAEAAAAGAVFTIALQPWIPFTEVNAAAVATSMTKLVGVTGGKVVWLRLAHEINWYIDTNSLNTDPKNKYHGTSDEFKAMWTAIAKAVDRSTVKMFWSPVGPFGQDATVSALNNDWYPGDDAVDIVGIDAYGQIINGAQPTFDQDVGAFCDFYKNKPMHLGETGWLAGGTPDQKKYWLEQVTSPAALARCPNYMGFSWFEYLKDGDYRIVTGSGGDIAKEVVG